MCCKYFAHSVKMNTSQKSRSRKMNPRARESVRNIYPVFTLILVMKNGRFRSKGETCYYTGHTVSLFANFLTLINKVTTVYAVF